MNKEKGTISRTVDCVFTRGFKPLKGSNKEQGTITLPSRNENYSVLVYFLYLKYLT